MFTFVCVTILIVHLNELYSISIARLIKSYLIKFPHEIELFAVCLRKAGMCFGKVEVCFWHITIIYVWYAIGLVCICVVVHCTQKCIEMLVCVWMCVCVWFSTKRCFNSISIVCRWHACSKIMGFGFYSEFEK